MALWSSDCDSDSDHFDAGSGKQAVQKASGGGAASGEAWTDEEWAQWEREQKGNISHNRRVINIR